MISLFFKFPNFQLAADPDPNVKNGAELLDRLIKVSAHWLIIFIIIIIIIITIILSYRPNVPNPMWFASPKKKAKSFIYCICSIYTLS